MLRFRSGVGAAFASLSFPLLIRQTLFISQGCADLGKTSCLASTLAYNLHFVVNHVTPDADNVATWDATMLAAHGDLKSFNAFMDYRLVFYTPSLDQLLANLLEAETPFMMRQASASSDTADAAESSSSEEEGVTWYSLIVASPSGKVFEVTSTQLNFKKMSATTAGKAWLRSQGGAVKEWTVDQNVCPHTQQQSSTSHSYTALELDAFHATFANGDATKLLPIRNQIAVTSLKRAKAWWSTYVPSVAVEDLAENTDTCAAASFSLPAYTFKDFMVETRLVENSAGVRGSADVKAFVKYIESVHRANTGSNRGWDAWYDRHLGLLFDKCPLDDYMSSFYAGSVSFNPHGRAETNEQGMATQHVWSEGVEGYGIEMQGFYDFSFRDCYSIFDWCTETTNGKQFCSADMVAAPTANPVQDSSASV